MSSLLKGKGEKRKGDQNVSGKQEEEGGGRGGELKNNDICMVTRGTGQYV